MAKNKYEGKTIEELISLEKGARLICSRYENEARINGEYQTNGENEKGFRTFTTIHKGILDAIEKKLMENV